jgi:hypothetical protein
MQALAFIDAGRSSTPAFLTCCRSSTSVPTHRRNPRALHRVLAPQQRGARNAPAVHGFS